MTAATSISPNIQPKGIVVDDDATWRDFFIRSLEKSGLRPQAVATCRDAMSLLGREFFHVALVDLSLVGDQNRDGLQVLRKIYTPPREGGEAILLSAYGDIGDGADAQAAGAFRVIFKPRVDFDEVVRVISQAKSQAEGQLRERTKTGLALLAGRRAASTPDLLTDRLLFALGTGFEATNEALVAALDGLGPFLTPSDETGVSVDTEAKTAVVDLWSKMLGRPINVLLARDSHTLGQLETALTAVGDDRVPRHAEELRRIDHRHLCASVLLGPPEPLPNFIPGS